MSDLLRNFVEGYERELDFYSSVARLCGQRCEALLAAAGIRAIVTHRAKKPQKLEDKITRRNKEKKYATFDDIRSDIPDLAGTRIALYFPTDKPRVSNIIDENFNVLRRKTFPTKRKSRLNSRFDGYCADHHRISFRDETLDDDQKRYRSASVEIQVGSVLMHGWAEVEHDLIYKPDADDISEDEYAILDELNGLVIAGEIALERLQRAIERRLEKRSTSFDSSYDLAAFLHRWCSKNLGMKQKIGRIDILWQLVKASGINNAEKLTEFISSHKENLSEIAISDFIIDKLVESNPKLYTQYTEMYEGRNAVSWTGYPFRDRITSNSRSVSRFLEGWVKLEEIIATAYSLRTGPEEAVGRRLPGTRTINHMASALGLPESVLAEIDFLSAVRNRIVHGSFSGERGSLPNSIELVERLCRKVKAYFENEKKSLRPGRA